MSCRIIIYEDNFRLRESLTLLLQNTEGCRVVASYPHCDNAAADVQEQQPNIVVMDIDMPGIGGLEGIKIIKNLMPEVKIIVHTMYDDDTRIFDCICAGADGYLLKNTSPKKFLLALQDVKEGGAPMSPFVAQKVFQYFKNKNPEPNDFALTPRELGILAELVHGNSYKMIAAILEIKIDTVRKHLQNIYHKLHVSSGTEAVAKALREKIVRID